MADIVSTVAHVAPFIPEENIPMVVDTLKKLPEEKLNVISMISFKKPFTTLSSPVSLAAWAWTVSISARQDSALLSSSLAEVVAFGP